MTSIIQRIKSIANNYADNSGIQFGVLVGITLLAAILRFYKLGEWSFWVDEVYTVLRTQAQFSTIESILNNIFPVRNWIPLSLISTGGALNLFGANEWSARLAPAVIGIISVPLLYFPLKRAFNPGVALIAALLLAVSPWHIYWSQNARFYTSLMLFYTLAVFALYFGLERDRVGYFILFIVLTYLAVSERLFALFIVPVVALYLFLLQVLPIEKPSGFRRRNLLILIVPVGIAGVLEIYNNVANGYSLFFGGLDWFLLYPSESPLRLLSFIGYNIGIPLMCLAFFGGIYLVVRQDRAGLLMFISAALPVVILLLLNPFVFTKDRYAFVSLAFWIILGAVSVKTIFTQTQNQGKILAVGLLFLFLADAGGAGLMYFHVNNGNRRDWKAAFALINERREAGDSLVTFWPELGDYYLRGKWFPWEEINPDMVDESNNRYWFVTDSETVWANGRMKSWVEQNAELIEVKYLRTPDDFSLRVYLYDPVASNP